LKYSKKNKEKGYVYWRESVCLFVCLCVCERVSERERERELVSLTKCLTESAKDKIKIIFVDVSSF